MDNSNSNSKFCLEALNFARLGFYVIPISPKQKAPPLIDEWKSKATRDTNQIKKWWKQWPEANIGIFTGKFGDNKALLVVDIDVKNNKKGEESFSELKKKHNLVLVETAFQKTPSGGRHLIFIVNEPVASSVCKLGSGIDIKSEGGYILGGGSVLK